MAIKGKKLRDHYGANVVGDRILMEITLVLDKFIQTNRITSSKFFILKEPAFLLIKFSTTITKLKNELSILFISRYQTINLMIQEDMIGIIYLKVKELNYNLLNIMIDY